MTQRRFVLVTGGARRLGAALCREFARRGDAVICHHLNATEEAGALVDELRAGGVEAHALQGALDTVEEVDAVFTAACAFSGRLDVVVNNAGIFEPDHGDEPSAAAWARHLDINVRAPVWLAARLAAHCRKRGTCGTAVHVLDQKIHALNPDYFSYTVSKLALAACVKLQAQALAPQLRVVGIAPGLLAVSGPQSDANFAWASQQNLLRRPVSLADVARACADVVANVSITGAVIDVDCGQHLLPQPRDVMFLGPRGQDDERP